MTNEKYPPNAPDDEPLLPDTQGFPSTRYERGESDETYNGWTNRETWAVNLWIGNDEGLYEMGREFARTLDSDDPRRDDKTRDWWREEVVPLLQTSETGRNAIEDIGSTWRIDWTATADALIESIAE